MSKKPGRTCKICKLKKSHPEAHKRITAQIMKGSEISIQKLLKILNKEFNINITPMNYQSHKGHTLDGKVHELKKSGPTVEVFSKEGDLQYTNIEEIIENLNPKHKLFCELYVRTFKRNGTKTILEVYGSDMTNESASVSASRLLSNANVNLYIKHLDKIEKEELGLNVNYVLKNLKAVAERSMEAEPVKNKDGDIIGDYVFNAPGANKALELIGKHFQMWDKKEQPADQTLYKKILEDFISNKLNPISAGIELGKLNIEPPKALLIAMGKVDPSILDKPAITDEMNLDDLTDDELDRLETENNL